MGCDGGTIPRRDELVKTKKKPEQKDKNSERLYRWRHCAVSQAPLKEPVVGCELGRIYNKEEVLTRLLDRASMSESAMSHIRGLKDIQELNLTPNPGYKDEGAQKGDAYTDHQAAQYICPVTSLEMNGKYRFAFVWTCGCVVSERALKEVPSPICHKCGQPYRDEDVIPLNPTEGEQEEVRVAMIARRAAAKAAKKAKKESIKRAAETEEEDTSATSKGKKAAKIGEGAGTSGEGTGRGPALRVNGMASALLRDKEFDKVRSAGFSVASDPKASEVYKSLFDTHKTAQKKQSAHWVTCNPQYF